LNDPKKESDNLNEWPTEKRLLVKMSEIQFRVHRLLVAGTEVIRSAQAGTKATANVTRSSLAALGVELQRTAQIKWPVRKRSWWRRFLFREDEKFGPPQNRTT
jgi:hypothetical protein